MSWALQQRLTWSLLLAVCFTTVTLKTGGPASGQNHIHVSRVVKRTRGSYSCVDVPQLWVHLRFPAVETARAEEARSDSTGMERIVLFCHGTHSAQLRCPGCSGTRAGETANTQQITDVPSPCVSEETVVRGRCACHAPGGAEGCSAHGLGTPG